jgi:hypothetical protein
MFAAISGPKDLSLPTASTGIVSLFPWKSLLACAS